MFQKDNHLRSTLPIRQETKRARMPSIMPGGNQALLITWPIPSLQSGLVMAASYGGDVLQQQELEDYSELRGR